jgi:hypothetical protein
VERFVVGKKDVGEVAYIDSLDLRGVNIDDIIHIEKGRIQVYGIKGGASCPLPGHGLNKPALLTFRCDIVKCEMRGFPSHFSNFQSSIAYYSCTLIVYKLTWTSNDKQLVENIARVPARRKMHVKQSDEKSIANFAKKLAAHAQKIGGVFVHYDASQGNWIMKVDHF